MSYGDRNFEGEADSGRMSLQMKTWTRIETQYTDGSTVLPRNDGAFTLTFTRNPVGQAFLLLRR